MSHSVSMESSFMDKVLGIFNFFKVNRDPYKDIEIEMKKVEKSVHNNTKSHPISKISILNDVVSKLIIWNYKHKITKGFPGKYISDIESAKGNYFIRDKKIQKSVYDMYTFISENYKNIGYTTVFDIFIKLFKIVTDKTWNQCFITSFKLREKGNDVALIVTIEYVAMVYVLEYLTLTLSEYILKYDSSSYNFDKINREYCQKHSAFVTAGVVNIIKSVVKYESIKDPKKFILDITKNEKIKIGTESEIFPNPDKSEESFIAISIWSGIGILLMCVSINALRYIIYSISCLKVDITKSLIDQSNLLLVNINKLKLKLATMKPGTSEYNNLDAIIKKQEKYTNILINICNKLSDDDIESIKNIKKDEIDDDENIKSGIDIDDPTSSTDFDI